MGAKKQTIGYHYLMTMLSGLWRGPINEMIAIKVGDKLAWSGRLSSNALQTINQPNLFGGEKKEGGIQGGFRLFMGAGDQVLPASAGYTVGSPVKSGTLQNPKTLIGGLVSELRGVVTFWFDGLFTSMNPYPKEWKFRGRRTTAGWFNDDPWYPAKAAIKMGDLDGFHAIYMALDVSASMAGTRLANMKTAVNGFLDYLAPYVGLAGIDVMIVAWGGTHTSITRRNCTGTSINELKAWVTSLGTVSSTDFTQGVADAPAFFAASNVSAQRTMIFLTDGEPNDPATATAAGTTVAGIANLRSYAFNIDLENTTYTALVDNTPDDGVPVIAGSNPDALQSALQQVISGEVVAMNPAHIVYECVTNPEWGRGLATALIDESSFTYSADLFYTEGFGICLTWYRKEEIDQFIKSILDHAGAALYTDRESGLLTLRPIRADYDPAELPTFDEDSGLIDILDDDSASPDTSYSEVIVTGHDPVADQDFEMRAQNPAAWQEAGAANPYAVSYPGLPTPALTGRVAARELKIHASGLKKFRVVLDRRAWRVSPASCFRVVSPRRNIGSIILRAGEIEESPINDGRITIRGVEDVFGMPDTSFIEPVKSSWTPPDTEAQPAAQEELMEAGYRDVYVAQGKTDADSLGEDDAVIMQVAAAPSATHLEFDLYTKADGETNYENRGSGFFTGTAVLSVEVTSLDTTFNLTAITDISEDNIGQALRIGNEVVELTAYAAGTATVKRGCADTVPVEHPASARLWTVDDDAVGDGRTYIAGETVYAKVLTKTSADSLTLAEATEESKLLDGRAFRPYPMADIKVDGDSIFTASETAVRIGPVFTWVHRNRLVQADTLVGHTEAGVAPEDGTTYYVKVYDADGVTVKREEDIGLVDTWTYSVAMQSADNPGGPYVFFDFWSKRDGVLSLFHYRSKVTLRITGDFVLESTTDNLVTESDDNFIYE